MKNHSHSKSRSRSGSNTSHREPQRKFNDSTPASKTLYITFLPENVEETELRQMFEDIGSVNRVNLRKKDDGFVFAFISYDSLDDAERAVAKLNRKKMGEKFISVKYAKNREGKPDEQRKEGGRRPDQRNDSEPRKKFDSNKRDQGKRDFGNRRNGNGDRPGRDGDGERRPMKCFKCHGEGHMSKNCPEGQTEMAPPRKKVQQAPEEDCDY